MPQLIFRFAALASCLWLLCGFYTSAQTGTPNFSGVWLRNAQKSPRGDHPPEEMQAKIEHNGADITITIRSRNNGTDEVNMERLRIGTANNANEIHGAPMTSQAAWEGGTLVVRSVAKFGDQELRMTDR